MFFVGCFCWELTFYFLFIEAGSFSHQYGWWFRYALGASNCQHNRWKQISIPPRQITLIGGITFLVVFALVGTDSSVRVSCCTSARRALLSNALVLLTSWPSSTGHAQSCLVSVTVVYFCWKKDISFVDNSIFWSACCVSLRLRAVFCRWALSYYGRGL